MEKNLNKEELRGFKKNQIRPTAMIPGIFNQSPLRGNHVVSNKFGAGIQSLNNTPRRDSGVSASMDHIDYKTVRTMPHHGQHKRATSYISLQPTKQEMTILSDYHSGNGRVNFADPTTRSGSAQNGNLAANYEILQHMQQTSFDSKISPAKKLEQQNRLALLMAKRQMKGKNAESPLAVVPPTNANSTTLASKLQFGRKATISQHASTEFLMQQHMQQPSAAKLPFNPILQPAAASNRSRSVLQDVSGRELQPLTIQGEKEQKHMSRLELLGLDHKASGTTRLQMQTSGKMLDQIQPHRDMKRYLNKGTEPGKAQFDFKRLSQHRNQQLPLGGMLGERVSKSISLLDSIEVDLNTQNLNKLKQQGPSQILTTSRQQDLLVQKLKQIESQKQHRRQSSDYLQPQKHTLAVTSGDANGGP